MNEYIGILVAYTFIGSCWARFAAMMQVQEFPDSKFSKVLICAFLNLIFWPIAMFKAAFDYLYLRGYFD